MSRNQSYILNAVKLFTVNILFLVVSVIIISAFLGNGMMAKANEQAAQSASAKIETPANVKGFKAATISASEVKLTWNKVSSADGYVVYRYNTSTKKYGRIAKGGNLSFTDKNLKAGTTYKYAIRSFKTVNGKEVLSSSYPEITATTNPANVTGFKVSATSASAIKLTWNKASGAQGYIVYQSKNGKWVRVVKTKTTANTYTVNKLSAGATYKFAVKAYKTASGKEISSAGYPQLSATTNPANVTGFKAASTSLSAVKLSWNKIGSADGYVVYRYNTSTKKYGRIAKGGSLSFTDKNLKAGTTYKYAIRAYKTVNGKEVLSPSYPEITTSTNLETVTGFKVSATSASAVKLTWNKVSGAQGYIVYQSKNGKWVRVVKTNTTSNTYTVNNLSSSTSYKFAVKAYKTVNSKEATSEKYPTVSATTKKATLAQTTMIAEKKYESTATHPYNKQTNTIIVNWNKVSNAKTYQVYIKGGKYSSWTHYKTVSTTNCTVSGLERAKTYSFKVRAVNGSDVGTFSNAQNIKTARMNFDSAGWEAMCRIVYHEVGQIDSSIWDRPIVYVSDCVVNRYVAAKYGSNNSWISAYRNYSNIQDIIYNSGGFMSSAGLTNDGAIYSRVPTKVKTAVYGAVYNIAAYKNIQNDGSVYFWCNRSYYQSDSRIAYTFEIPWGYFNIWRSYWG